MDKNNAILGLVCVEEGLDRPSLTVTLNRVFVFKDVCFVVE